MVAAGTLSTAWIGDGWQLIPGRAGSFLVWPGWVALIGLGCGRWQLTPGRAGSCLVWPGWLALIGLGCGRWQLTGLGCSHRGGIGGRWHALNGLDW